MPALPIAYLSRPRLLDALDDKAPRLRLLCAPAGFGKSALIAEWLQRRPAAGQVVWLSLAGRAQSLGELCAALAIELGLAPDNDASALLARLGTCDEPLWLVLDDLPEEMPAELNDWMGRLLALPTSKVQVLASARQRPAWNLPRLMLARELLELDAAQLALTRDECVDLVDLLAPGTERGVVDDLWRKSGGWCAGVRLLLAAPSQGRAIDRGDIQVLSEYLEHELLSRLDEEARGVLLGLAHLPKASTELCEQLWEGQGGGRLFNRLLQRQAFLFPIDSQNRWYQLLPVVAQALQEGLSGAALNRLRMHSCRVLSSFGHVEAAIEQALRAGQPEVAATYMERLRLAWLLTDRHLDRLMAWRDQLPPQLLESTPRLIYLCARALLISGRLDETEQCLQLLGNFMPQADPDKHRRLLANWQALQSGLEALRGNARTARQHGLEALEHLGAQDWLSILLCQSTLARMDIITGHLEQAGQMLGEAVELARRQGSLDAEVLLNTDRFRLMMLHGDLALAEALIREDMKRLASGKRRNPLKGRLLLLQGELLVSQGRLDEGEQALQDGLHEVQDCSAPFIVHGYLLLAEIAIQRQELERARLLLHEGERRMHCGNIDPACYQSAVDLQAARILARQQRWDQVLPLLRELESRHLGPRACLPPLQMPSLVLRSQLLLAQAEHQTGDVELAARRLRRVLGTCQGLRFERLAGEALRVMARIGCAEEPEAGGPDGEQGRAGALPLRGAEVAPYQDDLTPREVSVLKLLAQGMSIREVGNTLFISVNTVKTHAKNINVKLGACRRTQAINSAKAMGILA